MKINKFVAGSNEKPFHSNTYAHVAHGDAMGSTSSQSFAQRQRIENNRQMIQKYRDSYVANGSHLREELQRRIDSPQDTMAGDPKDKRHHRRFATNSRQAFNSTASFAAKPGSTVTPAPPIPPRAQFKEPPKRTFNPYG